jgi:hypothetical protein
MLIINLVDIEESDRKYELHQLLKNHMISIKTQ